MDQKKIGSFLKELRKEKNKTQQQIAEKLNVSNRTISRWETGSNMPDLDIVMDLADYYSVDIREILDGERKSEKMNKEMKETIIKVADYSNEEKQRIMKRMHILFLVGVASMILYMTIEVLEVPRDGLTGFISGVSMGISGGMLIVGALYTSRYFHKFRTFKRRMLFGENPKQSSN